MSDIISRRQRSPWLWPDVVYYLFGEGRLHDKTLKILHSFTSQVSNGASGCSPFAHYIKVKQNPCTLDLTRVILSQVIQERAENISYIEESDSDECTKKRQAFLDMLLKATDEDGNTMSHPDIQEEVDTFMFEVVG